MTRIGTIAAVLLPAVLACNGTHKIGASPLPGSTVTPSTVNNQVLGRWRGTLQVGSNTCGQAMADLYSDTEPLLLGDFIVHYDHVGDILAEGPETNTDLLVTANLMLNASISGNFVSGDTRTESLMVAVDAGGLTATATLTVNGSSCTLTGTIPLNKCGVDEINHPC